MRSGSRILRFALCWCTVYRAYFDGVCTHATNLTTIQFLPDMETRDFADAPIDMGISIGSAAIDVEGDARAYLDGIWSDAVNWPLLAIHAALLPNGDVTDLRH